MTLSSGTKLGPYEITAPIGAGGMGEVYRARDTRLGREVAIKVLPEHLAANAEALSRFEREARAVASLSHPNILSIHDFGVEGSTAYSVTELLEGETLRARMGGAPVPSRKALDYGLQIARGLAAAHEKGVVHRDLKPENLFVTTDGRVKILDFGLAKISAASATDLSASPTLEEGTRPGTVMGSVGYMSPEQVRGLPVDHRADIFSFGAVLFEMLTGRRPFQGPTAADTMSAILREDPSELSSADRSISPILERLVHHCMEKNPAERFQSARDLAFNLEAAGTASGTGPVEAIAGAVRADRTGRSSAPGLAAALVVGMLIGAGFALWLGRRPDIPAPTLRYVSYSGLESEPSASPDGRLIAYTSLREGHSEIWLRQYPGGDEVAMTTGSDDSAPRISPDGASILFTRQSAGVASLYKISVVGGEPRKILDDALSGDWSPDGTRIAYIRLARVQDKSVSIVGVVDVGGREPREIVTGEPSLLQWIRWSPDGRTIAATRADSENSPGRIFLTGVDGNGTRILDPPPAGGVLSSLAWSGDGSTLIYAQSVSVTSSTVGGSGARIIRQRVDTGRAETIMWIPAVATSVDVFGDGVILLGSETQKQNLRETTIAAGVGSTGGRWLTRGNSNDRQPTFSPDGKWVLFSSNRTGNLDLWKLSPETGAVHRITEDAADDWDPAFTPDGSWILWSSSRGGHFEIWICSADGTGARQLTQDGRDAENPTATRDGEWVVYNSTNPEKSGIWKIHPDGTGATLLVPGTWSTPDVSPDGAYVAFRTGTFPRRLRVARVADGRLLPFQVGLNEDIRAGRPRWMPDGASIAYVGADASGSMGVFVQPFVPEKDTVAQRRPMAGFDPGSNFESFGIAPDGSRLVYSSFDQSNSLMLAEGLPGVEAPRRKP